MKGESKAIGLIVAIISGVIGFVIVDDITTDTSNTYAYAENITLNNGTAVDLSKDVKTFTELINNSGDGSVISDTDYTVDLDADTLTLTNSAYDGETAEANYEYGKSEYLEKGVSRTIATYVVPIGLLSILAMAALIKV